MSSILSGLKDLGLGNLEKKSLFGEEEKQAEVKNEPVQQPEKKQIDEHEYVFAKSHTCPVCFKDFKAPAIRQSKLRPAGMDKDLRPKFKNFDPMKYDVILCPHCGYAALGRFFHNITPPQAKLVREGISRNFKPLPEREVFNYDEAFVRYQLALGNAMVKRGKNSEKAYLCLKMAWMLRSKKEAIEAGMEEVDRKDYLQIMEELEQDETELLSNAIDGFMTARQSESFPMCGMDEVTLDYIICMNAMKLKNYDLTNQMLNVLLVRSGLNPHLKDNLIEVKEELRNLKKEDA